MREAPSPTPVALPSRDDPTIAALSEPIGGPAGARAVPARRWWGPVRVTLAVACAVFALGVIADTPCRESSWAERDHEMWTSLCYSDISFLYRERGFAEGEVPYTDTRLEYPVLLGAVMQGSAYLAQAMTPEDAGPVAVSGRFYDVTAVLLGIAMLITVFATARTVRRRPWDGMLVAASPILLLTATINWDLLAVAATSLAILAWTRRRGVLTGLFLGLGAAAKLYPVLLLGVLLLVVLRSPKRRQDAGQFVSAVGASIVTWAAVNLPVYLWAPDGWKAFFTFNNERAADFGSIWFALEINGVSLPEPINLVALSAAGVLLVAIVILALTAPEQPRLAQLAFLAVAAFLLVNKVWSPQYALWLLPLAALARPRWRDVMIWQLAEVGYFVAVWWYLAEELTAAQYGAAVAIRVAGLLWLVSFVVRDIVRPAYDPVRPYADPLAPLRPSLART
ncbi:MAG TPA: glycosyltransferase 87 family protein [Jiangellaceae bacterium]